MTPVSANELELLTFFEVEPTKRDADVPWPYNDFVYEVRRAEVSVSFALAPAYKDVRLIVKRADTTLYELNAMAVDDVRYHNEANRELLEIVVSSRDRLWLRLNSEVSLYHNVSEKA